MSCGARRNYAAQSANLIVLYRRLYVARGSAYRIDVNSTKILFHLRSWLQLVIGKIRERSMIINVRRWNQLRQTCFCYSELNDISILFFPVIPSARYKCSIFLECAYLQYEIMELSN